MLRASFRFATDFRQPYEIHFWEITIVVERVRKYFSPQQENTLKLANLAQVYASMRALIPLCTTC